MHVAYSRVFVSALAAILSRIAHSRSFVSLLLVPAYAIPGNMMAAKAGGAAGVPLVMAYLMGNQYEKDCRARNFGMSPPRICKSKRAEEESSDT